MRLLPTKARSELATRGGWGVGWYPLLLSLSFILLTTLHSFISQRRPRNGNSAFQSVSRSKIHDSKSQYCWKASHYSDANVGGTCKMMCEWSMRVVVFLAHAIIILIIIIEHGEQSSSDSCRV